MDAVVSFSSSNKQAKAQRNRHSRFVDLVTRSSSTAADDIYNYRKLATAYSIGGNKQPPLLPLPAAVPTPQTASGFSTNKKKLSRHQSLNPRKSPPSKPQVWTREATSGPDPDKLRRGVIVSATPYQGPPPVNVADWFSGDFVFALAPPPSSLPLPRFCLRPKLRCTMEAGVESGAGEGVRRVVRLR